MTESPGVTGTTTSTPTGSGRGEGYAFPVTAGQQAFWYLDRLRPGNPAYNIALRFRLTGPLRPALLGRALTEVARRHEGLRTTFAVIEGELLQVVAPPTPVLVPVDDLPGDADPRRVEELVEEEARRPFDLEAGPLFRARLLRFGDTEHLLLLTVHHIVADGWSTGIITNELAALYAAFDDGRPSPLPEPELQFGDFAVWQAEWLQSPAVAVQRAYWERRLAGLEPLFVPHDKNPAPGAPLRGRIDSLLLPRALTDRLTDLSARQGVTLFMTCLAGLKLLLRLRTGREDVAVGTLVAGRARTELEPVVGLFVNTLVLRTDLAGDPTFLELLDRTRATVLGAMDHQELPFGSVVEAVRLRRQNNRNHWFGVNFLFQRAFLTPSHPGALAITPVPSVSPGAMLDLNWIMVQRDEGWRLSCEYSPDEYEPETVRGLLAQFHQTLEEAAADPHRRLSAFGPVARSVSQAPPGPEPAPDRSAPSSGPQAPAPTAPHDGTEAQLAAVWGEVFRTAPVSATADFYDLGGHSLLAARLVNKVQDRFGVRLSPAVLFEHPTVRQMARLLTKADHGRNGTPAAPDRFRDSVPHTNGMAPRTGTTAHAPAPHHPPEPAAGRRAVPFFFPSAEGPLYGVYAPPTERDRGEGVVLCAPPGHEYMTTHICLRLLATELSRAGFHVLRFDYSCLGNSWGSFEEATADRWVRDIGTAARELAARSGASALSLVGLRLGGALAYRAACATRVKHLLLWDPVTNGREYLGQLRRMQTPIAPPRSGAARGAVEDLLGYSYSPDLVGELERLELTADEPPCDRVSFVLSEDAPGTARLLDHLDRRGRRPVVRSVTTHGGWTDDFTNHVLPHQALRAVVDLLGRASP